MVVKVIVENQEWQGRLICVDVGVPERATGNLSARGMEIQRGMGDFALRPLP
jgi:hypothetical protein